METNFIVVFNLQALGKISTGSMAPSALLSSAPALPQAIQAFCGDLGDFKIKRKGDNQNICESL